MTMNRHHRIDVGPDRMPASATVSDPTNFHSIRQGVDAVPTRKRLRDRIRLAQLKLEETRRPRPVPREVHPIEIELERAGSLARLEQLAGIGADRESRAAFWRPFARLPARDTIEAGCVELRRMARRAAGAPA